MLDKFERFNEKICAGVEWVGFAALLLMMALTCVDVVGAKVFRMPVFGSLDVMMLAQLLAISCAGAMAHIVGRHVSVEFLMMLFPKRVQAFVEIFIGLICLIFFIFVVWRLFAYGADLQEFAEETPTARIQVFPFAYIAALAIIPLCLVFVQQIITSILKAVNNES